MYIKPVYKRHLREPTNVPFMSSCPVYTGLKLYELLIYREDEDVLYRQ